MRKIIKLIRAKSGESLIEAVASILVFTMSSIILLSMIATASKINYAAKLEGVKLSDELFVAEAQDETVSGTVVQHGAAITIEFKNNIIVPYTVSVSSYSSGDGSLYSYAGN